MALSLSPIFNPDHPVSDANGAPRAGALLFTYIGGTSTKVTVKKDSAGAASHTNPIVLDASGLPPAPIWLTQGSTYKFYLAAAGDTDPPTSPLIPPIDNITGINDVADVVSTEWTPTSMVATYISTTSFSVTGDQTSTLDVNRRLKFNCTAGTRYGYITKSTFTSLTTVTVLLDSGNLDTGINTVSSSSDPTRGFLYGIISAANTSLPFFSRDQQCGRLGYVSATSIRLDPQDGNTIWVYTAAAGWARRAIPSAGISAANTSVYVNGTSGQNLAASTTYYVYLFDNSGTLTMDFSTTAYAVDATSGLGIKSGVATRLLIGMVRTNGSTPGQFQTPALVLSWYKRRRIVSSAAFTTSRTTTSTTFVEINAEIQVPFLTWGDEAVHSCFSGWASNGLADGGNATKIVMDAAATLLTDTRAQTTTVNAVVNQSMAAVNSPSEGYHYMTIYGSVINASTGTWASGDDLFVVTQG